MHSLYQIASGHVRPLPIIELLQLKGKKMSTKFKMSNRVGARVQMELKSKWNSCFECKQKKKKS